jgi:4-hydroxy-tetrahydrodipicolinate reductase
MKLAIIGYGKMGQAVAKVALDSGWSIVAKVKNGDEWDPNDWGADIVFESSSPGSAVDNSMRCIKAGLPVVIGTTGWHSRLPELEHSGGLVFYATNFSLGIHLMNNISKYMTRVMTQFSEYNVSIKEEHHTQKLDLPSGTALTLSEVVEAEGVEKEIEISASRKDNVVGSHELCWVSEVDELVLRHKAISRQGFALGAFQALNWLLEKDRGVFTMNDMITEIR